MTTPDGPIQRHTEDELDCTVEAYHLAQRAVADLKAAILMLIKDQDTGEGLRNVDIGRRLGIYGGHVKHVGHVPRTLLARMESEGVVVQDPDTDRWRIREH